MSKEFSRSLQQVHLINAVGPFVHGVWTNGRESIGNEEALRGRALFLVSQFVKVIEQNFSQTEIQGFSLVDIGCYDGFLSVEIAKRLPLKRVVGVEPRDKNLRKGVLVREYLGIETPVEFRIGDIDSLACGEDGFDLVFCSGVFHHLSDINDAIKKLRRIAKVGVFIDTQCYVSPFQKCIFSRILYRMNEKVIEPKDVIYKFLPKEFALSGHKFESGYYDGSALGFSMVTIPSQEMILMGLKASGFGEGVVVSSSEDYMQAFQSNLRSGCRLVSVFAKVSDQLDFSKEVSGFVEEYERSMIQTVVDDSLALKFEGWVRAGGRGGGICLYILTREWDQDVQWLIGLFIRCLTKDTGLREILTNIKYKPFDKISFELAKWYISKGYLDKSSAILEDVVGSLNADWRVSYRSFAVLSLIAASIGDTERQKYFEKACLDGNPSFPRSILASSIDDLFAGN